MCIMELRIENNHKLILNLLIEHICYSNTSLINSQIYKFKFLNKFSILSKCISIT